MAQLLSKLQRSILGRLSAETYRKLGKPAGPTTQEESDWRHAQVKACCGAEGLRDASNADFLRIKAHFENLAGESGKAFETEIRAQGEELRQARHNLAEIIARGDLTAAYAEELARDKFGASLAELNAAQVLNLVITIKARVLRKEDNHRAGPPKRRDKKRKPADEPTRLDLDPSDTDSINALLAHHATKPTTPNQPSHV